MMLNLRKKTLAVAVAAAAAWGGWVSTAQAQTVSANNLGEALIYPYYSVRDGWRTFIHVTNTSDQTVAVKVRFHESKSSRDVLDFSLVLSPQDMWTAVVEERDGAPGVRPTDNSCTVPTIGSGNFKAFDPDATGIDLNDMREGYVEIVQMGSPATEEDDIAVAAKHDKDTGVPESCSDVEEFFASATAIQDALTLYPTNVLAGKFDLINIGTATKSTSASRAVAIANFAVGPLAYPQISNQEDLPNLACVGLGGTPPPATCANVAVLEAALGATAISNEWVLNPGLGELSSWVVTFPTKYLSTDTDIFPEQAPPRCGSTADKPVSGVPITIALFNREEKGKSGVSFSPAFNVLCNEVNVINFTSGTSFNSATLLNSAVSKTINVDSLASPFLGGWARISHSTADTSLPAVGFNLTARSELGDAVLYDHVYEGRP